MDKSLHLDVSEVAHSNDVKQDQTAKFSKIGSVSLSSQKQSDDETKTVELNDKNKPKQARKDLAKQSMKRYKSFRTRRAEDLERRYAAFQYEYKDCDPSDFQNA